MRTQKPQQRERLQLDQSRQLKATTLCEMFADTVAHYGDQIALQVAGGGMTLTWNQYRQRVKSLASGLYGLGVRRGDTVAMMLRNRPEMQLLDTALLHLGAAPFSIYNTSAPSQIRYLFNNAGNRFVICDRPFLAAINQAREGTSLDHVICVDGEAPGALSLAEVEAMRADDFDFEQSRMAAKPDDLATLIYTSGTTGNPKGVEITHASILANARGLVDMFDLGAQDSTVSYLPAAHIADRLVAHYMPMAMGYSTTLVADATKLVPAMLTARPSFFVGVPRVWEKLMGALQAAGLEAPLQLPGEVRQGALAKLGLDRVRVAGCGAAPIPEDVLRYFMDMGLPVQEVWGMSEISGVGTVNPIEDIRIGSVGVACRDLELKLADDGELLCRGPQLMRGYRNQPDKTREAIDEQGWLHTGDVATIDDDGYLYIVDRKKELIINSAGKNMSPAYIERRIKSASPFIGQAVVIGDARSYNVALIVPDPEVCAAYAKREGLADDSVASVGREPEVQAAIAKAIEQANMRLSRIEQIKRYQVLPNEWLPGGVELTPTSKLRRKPIEEKYAAEIDALYRDE